MSTGPEGSPAFRTNVACTSWPLWGSQAMRFSWDYVEIHAKSPLRSFKLFSSLVKMDAIDFQVQVVLHGLCVHTQYHIIIVQYMQ